MSEAQFSNKITQWSMYDSSNSSSSYTSLEETYQEGAIEKGIQQKLLPLK